jgi:hypothetical protein
MGEMDMPSGGMQTMAMNTVFGTFRWLGLLLVALSLCGCPVYPAYINSDQDNNGRFESWQGGGAGGVLDPSMSMYDATGGDYGWSPLYDSDYYYYRGGENPHRYGRH